jgi:hypothetical protein
MPLAADDTQKLLAFINSRWKSKLCLICGDNGWAIHGVLQLGVSEPRELVPAGQSLPCAAMVCQVCGNTVLVNLVVAGIG